VRALRLSSSPTLLISPSERLQHEICHFATRLLYIQITSLPKE